MATPTVIDIPLGNLSQNEPDHAGPLGRLTSVSNGEIVTYDEAHQNGPPQRNTIRQRNGFTSLPTEIRSVLTGEIVDDDFTNVDLLAPVSNQLVSIAHSIPNVLTGESWARYDNRVLTQSLSQDIVHTTNHVIQAPDSAWLSGVECLTWTETLETTDNATTYVGFRTENGAWLVKPRILFAGNEGVHSISRVVQDGNYFWVFAPAQSTPDIKARVYDTHGIELASGVVARTWVPTPGWWDIVATPTDTGELPFSVLLAQPGAWSSDGTDVQVQLTAFGYDSTGPSVVQQTEILYDMDCAGPLGFFRNTTDDLSYLGTIGAIGEGNAPGQAYQITNLVVTHVYDIGANFDLDRVDSLTGYSKFADDDTVTVGMAVSLLAPQGSDGPPYDPALRCVASWEINNANTSTFIAQHNNVLLQSRAFQVEDDFYAVTFYQSGPQLIRNPTPETIDHTAGDFMTGALNQPVAVQSGDTLTGNTHVINNRAAHMFPTQTQTGITHTGGDGVVAATGVWTLANGAFLSGTAGALSALNSYLSVTGATPSSLNTAWRVVEVLSGQSVRTEQIGGNGAALVNSSLSGASIDLTGVTTFLIPVDADPTTPNRPIPANVAGFFIGGSLTVAGASASANNHVFPIRVIEQDVSRAGATPPSIFTDCTLILGIPPVTSVPEIATTGWTFTLAPLNANLWTFVRGEFPTFATFLLKTENMPTPANNGLWSITAVTPLTQLVTGTSPLLPDILTGNEIISVQLDEPGFVLNFFLQDFTFDPSYVGGFVNVSGSAHSANDGSYQILASSSGPRLITLAATGNTGQVNEEFGGSVTITITKPVSAQPALQPTWFIQPLSHNQETVGRFENGVAFANWRFDGDQTDVPNFFLGGLSSVSDVFSTKRFSLPYRALSFVSDQTLTVAGRNLSQAGVQKTTVGIKDFEIAFRHGQAFENSGTLLLPGPQASQFSLSGFTEQGINLGFEKPFYIEQDPDAQPIPGLTKTKTFLYVAVAEATDENGDLIPSPPSPQLEVTLTGSNNQITIGGRLIGPTNRLVAISIYRTVVLDGVPTTEHHRITDPLDVNGRGFSFDTEGYNFDGLQSDTWIFNDVISDLSAETGTILYTDKGLLDRFPAPAFKQGAFWKNRQWVIGYDNTVWMSGEKTEGDSLWFHPAFRYVLPTEDEIVALAPMDDYLIVLGKSSFWYIPASNQLPGANGIGELPTPVQIQFQGGCNRFAVPTRNGVVYANTAGGVWLITRDLRNVWLSQPLQNALTRSSNVTGLAIDENQRIYVSTSELHNRRNIYVFDQISNTWWDWPLPSTPNQLCIYQGVPTYQDTTYVNQLDRTSHHDTRGTTRTGCPPSYEFADLDFGGIRNFKVLWALQLLGTYKGPHTLHAEISYPDQKDQPPTLFEFDPDPDEEFIYEINPMVEESSTYGLRVWVTFADTTTANDSFEFELISAEVGITKKGMNYLPNSQRKPAT